jgi:hypothetical protein
MATRPLDNAKLGAGDPDDGRQRTYGSPPECALVDSTEAAPSTTKGREKP